MICLMPMCAYLSETSRMIQIYKALVARGAEVRVENMESSYWMQRYNGARRILSGN